MSPQLVETTRAPIRTLQATYTWGDYTVKVNEDEGGNGTMTVSVPNPYDQRDERSQECILTLDLATAPDAIRVMQHALDHRESAR